MQKTEAKRIKTLFKKHKGLIKDHQKTANFKEPILILMRRGNKAEFYEKANTGEFTFEHSDGTTRHILINQKNLQTFDYGQKTFRGYICHEDTPIPLPEEPIVTSELLNIAINKTLNDIKKWKAEETKAKGELIWKAGLAIAVIILAYAMYTLLKPEAPPTQIVQTLGSTATAAAHAIKNGTTITALG